LNEIVIQPESHQMV